MLEIKNIKKSFGQTHVLHDVSLSVNKGDVIAILGPSGSGKTTLLRCLNFLEKADGGTMTFDDETIDLHKVPKRTIARIRKKTAFVFQNYNLFANKTALQNVTEGLIVGRKMPKDEANRIAHEALKKVGMEDRSDYYPSQLSGGQQQRVAIARTLAPEPQVLFMDEPLSNLDAKLRLEMRYELQRLHVETGSTFVYVTHDQMEAMTLATKICLINNGVLQQYDAPLTVYNRPNNLFVADFVGNPSINFVEAKGKQEADGSIAVSILDGIKAKFKPSENLDLKKWFAQRDRAEEEAKARSNAALQDKKAVEKGNKDEVFKYHIAKVNEDDYTLAEEPVITNEDFVLGIRPENIRMSAEGKLEGIIYGAMPTGMESTVKLRVGDYLLTSVAFGGTVFKIGTKTNFGMAGNYIMLFDRKSGKYISAGELVIE